MKKLIPVLFIVLTACSSAQINSTLGGINDVLGSGTLSELDVSNGLKEALIQGINKGSAEAGKTDGFLKSPEIKIPLPEDIVKIENRLRQLGLGNEVDKFLVSMNRGAEDAAKLAAPIFVDAIKKMTVQDAWGILKGEDDSATRYLESATSEKLYEAFSPVVQSSLEKVNATKYYTDLVTKYNQIPLVQKINPDLNDYVTKKSMDGLFHLIEKEEKNIREDPLDRTTSLMKKVFAQQD